MPKGSGVSGLAEATGEMSSRTWLALWSLGNPARGFRHTQELSGSFGIS